MNLDEALAVMFRYGTETVKYDIKSQRDIIELIVEASDTINERVDDLRAEKGNNK